MDTPPDIQKSVPEIVKTTSSNWVFTHLLGTGVVVLSLWGGYYFIKYGFGGIDVVDTLAQQNAAEIINTQKEVLCVIENLLMDRELIQDEMPNYMNSNAIEFISDLEIYARDHKLTLEDICEIKLRIEEFVDALYEACDED
jgi:hypothetical protein